MNFDTNIKITGFFQIMQSILIVFIYNVLALNVFPSESTNISPQPSILFIFSSQIVGFLFTGITLMFLFGVEIPEKFLNFEIKIKHLLWSVLLLIIANIMISLYQYTIIYIIPPYFVASYLSLQQSLEQNYHQLANLLIKIHPIFLYLIGALLPAICEEFFFRGYLQNLALKFYSPVQSIILVSSLFAIFHFQITAMIPLFIFGLALGIITYRSQRLIYSILLHFINNLTTLYFISNS